MTVLVVVCALLLTSLIVGLVLGAFIRAGELPARRPYLASRIVIPTACAWCRCYGWHADDCRVKQP